MPSSRKDYSRAIALVEVGGEEGGIFWLRRYLCALGTLGRESSDLSDFNKEGGHCADFVTSPDGRL